VSDTCVRSSLLSCVELRCVTLLIYFSIVDARRKRKCGRRRNSALTLNDVMSNVEECLLVIVSFTLR